MYSLYRQSNSKKKSETLCSEITHISDEGTRKGETKDDHLYSTGHMSRNLSDSKYEVLINLISSKLPALH